MLGLKDPMNSYTIIILSLYFFILKERNTFIQQWHIKSIKIYIKDIINICNVTKDFHYK